jgi:hypothetical protein
MAIRRRIWAVLSAGLFGALSVAIGCYRPSIESGGFKCATGNVCPDGFHCVTSNNRCYQGDAGPEAAACTAPTPAPTENCSRGPDSGICNPSCQTGCGCGFCSVTSGTTTCLTVTAGKNDIGEFCDPTKTADCKAGLFCRPECQTSAPAIGRCYKFCGVDGDCQICSDAGCQSGTCGSTGSSSDQSGRAPLSVKLCNIPAQQCSPIGMTSGCPMSPGQDVFACYADSTGQTTLCDCKGVKAAGATGCLFANDCAPGYNCVGMRGTNTCLKTCASNDDCVAPAVCNPLTANGKYGYCM